MSFLAPLYLLGGLAIGLPILFHLIRRTPKSDLTFSSLMFLDETPPQLTRRSRLDHLPLLLLRVLALALLAIAFARPLIRSAATVPVDDTGSRTLVMIDTSASMKRGDLWTQATDRIRRLLSRVKNEDELAVLAFDSDVRPLVGFDSELTTAERREFVLSLLDSSELSPTWNATDTAKAFATAAGIASEESEDRSANSKTRIVLVSDIQRGGNFGGLQGYAWPENVAVDVVSLETPAATNASAVVVNNEDAQDEAANDFVRVRVTNAADSSEAQFTLAWDADEATVPLPIQVPPGQSRIVRMPVAKTSSPRLVLRGDDHSFDNDWFVPTPAPTTKSIWFIGGTTEKPKQDPYFYLSQLPLGDSINRVETQSFEDFPADRPLSPDDVSVVIVARAIGIESAERLTNYLSVGGHVVMVLTQQDDHSAIEQTLRRLSADESVSVHAMDVEEYALLSEIDFSDPVFAPLDDPKFNDFTKVRFWSLRDISKFDGEWNTIARFDNGSPAIIKRSVSQGVLQVLASGWHPAESQLALSSKFVPVMQGLLRGQTVRKLDRGLTVGVGDHGHDQPGIFDDADSKPIAVNLATSESDTTPMSADWMDTLNVPRWNPNDSIVSDDELEASDPAERQLRARQLRDSELESSQSLWRTLLVIAVGILGVETILAKVMTRQR